jgi:hypothetical protein
MTIERECDMGFYEDVDEGLTYIPHQGNWDRADVLDLGQLVPGQVAVIIADGLYTLVASLRLVWPGEITDSQVSGFAIVKSGQTIELDIPSAPLFQKVDRFVRVGMPWAYSERCKTTDVSSFRVE